LIIAREKTGQYDFWGELPYPKEPRRRRQAFKNCKIALTGLVMAIFLTGVLITYYYSQLFALGYQISRLNKELDVLRVENHNLDEEIQQLAALDRIESVAVHKLNMVKPDANKVLLVTVAAATKEPAAAGGAQNSRSSDIAPNDKTRTLIVRAFDELVNRLGSKSRLGGGQDSGLWEGAYADNKRTDSKKNNLVVPYSLSCFCGADFALGLASTG